MGAMKADTVIIVKSRSPFLLIDFIFMGLTVHGNKYRGVADTKVLARPFLINNIAFVLYFRVLIATLLQY